MKKPTPDEERRKKRISLVKGATVVFAIVLGVGIILMIAGGVTFAVQNKAYDKWPPTNCTVLAADFVDTTCDRGEECVTVEWLVGYAASGGVMRNSTIKSEVVVAAEKEEEREKHEVGQVEVCYYDPEREDSVSWEIPRSQAGTSTLSVGVGVSVLGLIFLLAVLGAWILFTRCSRRPYRFSEEERQNHSSAIYKSEKQ